MRKLLENVTLRLQEFVAQRDDLAMVLRCGEAESALLIKVVESLQDTASSELVWVAADDFTAPEAYATAVIDGFAAKHEAVRLRQPGEGMPQWPALPASLRNASLPPVERLRELMIFSRSLLPSPEGMRVVWALFPLKIAKPAEYAELIRALLKHDYPFPWCHHMRIIVREDSAKPVLADALKKAPRIAWFEPDLSQKAAEDALNAEIADPKLPMEQRLQAAMITAAIDFAHRRYEPAMEKYQLVFRYFAHAGNLGLMSLALNGMGEVHRARGDLNNAGACFEAALVPATDGKNPPLPVLMNVIMNLAGLRMLEKRWADAEVYYDQAQQLAAGLRNPMLKVAMIEQLGEAQMAQGKIKESVASWNVGATMAEKLELPGQRRSILEKLRQHFLQTRDAAQLQEVEKKLQQGERGCKRPG